MSVSSRKKSPAWRSTSRKRCSLCSSPNTSGKRGQRKGFQVRGGSKRCQMTACSVSGTRTCSCSLGTAYPPDGHLGTCTTSDHCFIKFTCLLYVCTHMCAHTHTCHTKGTYMEIRGQFCESQKFPVSILSFRHVGPRDGPQVHQAWQQVP